MTFDITYAVFMFIASYGAFMTWVMIGASTFIYIIGAVMCLLIGGHAAHYRHLFYLLLSIPIALVILTVWFDATAYMRDQHLWPWSYVLSH